MNRIFSAKVINPYRAKGKRYDWLRGHTGTDLAFSTGDTLESPVMGQILAITHQQEMGTCIYLVDSQNNCHVFAHLQKVFVVLHQAVKRGDKLAQTDNTGTATSGPHLHYEIITINPVNPIDRIMYRKELAVIFKGFNTDPILYLTNLYRKYGINIFTGKETVTHNPNGF